MNKISSDVILSSVFAVLAVLFNFWLIKEAEFYLSASLLGIFMLMRRLAPTFSNFSQLGCSQALIRFASLNKDDEDKIKGYFFISIALWVTTSILLIMLYFVFKDGIGTLLLPKNENRDSYLALTFLYISILHLSYLILPYFLNLRRIFIYNFINVMNASLIMLCAFFIMSDSADLIQILKTALLIMAVFQGLLLVYIFFVLRLYDLPTKEFLKVEGKSFFQYGLPRAAMTFLEMFMLTVGSLLVKEEHEIVGSFLIAITLARVILIILQPMSLLSSVITGHNNETEKPKKILNLLFGGIIYSSVFVIIILYNWIEVLIRFWLSNESTIVDVVSIFRILVYGLIPYCIFQGLKGVIEIKFFKPMNLYSIVAGTATHIAFYFILLQFYETIMALSISLMMAFIVMGICSFYWCRKDFKGSRYFKFLSFLIVATLLFVLNYYLNSYYPNIIGLAMAIIITTGGFLFFVLLSKSDFAKDVLGTFNFTFLNRFIK